MKTLRHAAGELLVVGLSGTELTGLERAWLDIVRPGGIILFRRNIQDVAQTHGLLDAATGVCAPHAFRLVDLEGGAVDRLRDALAPLPSAQAVFRAAHQRKSRRGCGSMVSWRDAQCGSSDSIRRWPQCSIWDWTFPQK